VVLVLVAAACAGRGQPQPDAPVIPAVVFSPHTGPRTFGLLVRR